MLEAKEFHVSWMFSHMRNTIHCVKNISHARCVQRQASLSCYVIVDYVHLYFWQSLIYPVNVIDRQTDEPSGANDADTFMRTQLCILYDFTDQDTLNHCVNKYHVWYKNRIFAILPLYTTTVQPVNMWLKWRLSALIRGLLQNLCTKV